MPQSAREKSKRSLKLIHDARRKRQPPPSLWQRFVKWLKG